MDEREVRRRRAVADAAPRARRSADPSRYTDGHPASFKLDLFDLFEFGKSLQH
jgi:hypothetical protein